jgi:hypothetical protein
MYHKWHEFRREYNLGKEIDADIFNKNCWFRLPNQTKGMTLTEKDVRGSQHIIKRGKMSDFVLKYIPEDAVELEYEFEEQQTIKKFVEPKNVKLTRYNNMPCAEEKEYTKQNKEELLTIEPNDKNIECFLDYARLIDDNLIIII